MDGKGAPQMDRTQLRDKRQQPGPVKNGISEEAAQRLMEAVKNGNRPAKKVPPETRLYCLNGPYGLAPHINGEVYWQPWSQEKQATGSQTGKNFDMRFDCQLAGTEDLSCLHTNTGDFHDNPKLFPRPFNRMAYHLFFSTRRMHVGTRQELLDGPHLLSELYRRSLLGSDIQVRETPPSDAPESEPGDEEIHKAMEIGGASSEPLASSRPVDPRWDTIWTYWDYPNGPDVAVQLNIDSWAKHAPNMKIVRINESNIREYVPDCPDEFFRFPYAAAKSDFVRASLLYHRGGVYMDTDFFVNEPHGRYFAKSGHI